MKAVASAVLSVGLVVAPTMATAAEPSIDPRQGPTVGGTLTTITGELRTVTDMALGNGYALALMSDGTMYGTGRNNEGQLGNGTTASVTEWTAIDLAATPLAGKAIIDLDINAWTSYALTAEGEVFSWGSNGLGMLGHGSGPNTSIPARITMSGALAGKKVTQIAAGLSTTHVLAEDGTVYSWGSNFWGGLGDGTRADSAVPVAVNMTGYLAGKRVASIEAADNSAAYALTEDGKLFSWGYHGQTGATNSDYPDALLGGQNVASPIPVDQSAMTSPIVRVFGLRFATFAMTADGALYGWGSQTGGALGNGVTTGRAQLPVRINASGPLAGKEIADLVGGENYAIAVLADGSLFGWGDNVNGHLGLGKPTGTEAHATPALIGTNGTLAGSPVSAIASRLETSLALTESGEIHAWGENQYGGYGNGTTSNTGIPVLSWDPAASVTFGGVPATGVTVLSSTRIQAVAPAHPSGVVDVRVSFNGVESVIPGGYTFGVAPAVTLDPLSVELTADTDLSGKVVHTLTSEATGDEAPTVQWQQSTDKGATWTDVPGQNARALDVAVTHETVRVLYHAVFTNGLGTATSKPAEITIKGSTAVVPPKGVTPPPKGATTAPAPHTPDAKAGAPHLPITGPMGIAVLVIVAVGTATGGLLLVRRRRLAGAAS